MILTNNIVPDQVAKLFFACVTLQETIPEIAELIPVLAGAVEENLFKMTSQHLQMMLKALVTSKLPRHELDKFVPGLAQQLVDRAEDFTEENIPNILWCAAKLQGRVAPRSAETLRDLMKVFTSIVDVWLDRIAPSKLA